MHGLPNETQLTFILYRLGAAMSLDYPFYEELRKRQHPAAKWWQWGDILYYFGLLPAVLLSFPFLWSLFNLPVGGITRAKIWVFALFAFFITIFMIGTRLKLKAWTMAKKDGIDVDDY